MSDVDRHRAASCDPPTANGEHAGLQLGSDVFLVRGTAEQAAGGEESGRLGDSLLSAGRGPAPRHQLPPDPAPFEM